MTINLTKFIADSGYCSRRKAENLIRQGLVFLNSKKAKLGAKVKKNDEVKIGKKILKLPKEKIYIMLNKPVGYVCTNRKFKNEKNVFDLLDTKEKLHIVGRLDKNSRGLILLTNDGNLNQKITHPKYQHEKEYLVKISNPQKTQNIEEKMLKGIDIGDGDGTVCAKKIKKIKNNLYSITLTQGKKRQIRRMFKKLNCQVLDLKRIRIGNIKLKDLPEGKYKKIKIKI